MMGRLKHDQGQFFYSFRLSEAVPRDHPVRQIASVLDLSWVHLELAPFYPNVGRPSIDPEAHGPDADKKCPRCAEMGEKRSFLVHGTGHLKITNQRPP